MSTNIREVLERIDAAKVRMAMSDRQISLSAGMQPDQIRELRRSASRGEGSVEDIDLEAVAKVLGVPFQWLLSGEEEPGLSMEGPDRDAVGSQLQREIVIETGGAKSVTVNIVLR